MKNARTLYAALLKLYPRRYRQAFGAQMLQTFLDHYQDVVTTEGRVGLAFWWATLCDEVPNIVRQHATAWIEERSFLQPSAAKLALAALLLFPLFALCYAAFVHVCLTLPHPHTGGIGVLFALAALLLLPGGVSLMVSYILASACIHLFAGRKAEAA